MPDESRASEKGDQTLKYEEADLIRRICEGERELFQTLIQPHQRTAFSVAYSVLSNAADAEEVTQEAFIKAFKNLRGFRGEAKFSTWLIQITLNEARRRLRCNSSGTNQSEDEAPPNEAADYVPRDLADWREIPSEALARKELRQTIERTIHQLPPIYRQVLLLRDVQQLSTQETSQLLEISEELVKTRLRRARLHMREALAPGYDGSWTAESVAYRSIRPW
ncbi:MAG: sigma-70 family RNA polymerase sigma factor [Bryobacteraceae bacterium]